MIRKGYYRRPDSPDAQPTGDTYGYTTSTGRRPTAGTGDAIPDSGAAGDIIPRQRRMIHDAHMGQRTG